MKKKLTILTLITLLAIGTAFGCGKKETATKDTAKKTESTTKATTATKAAEAATTTAETTTAVATTESITQAQEQTQEVAATKAEPAYTYTDLSATKYAKSSVNVRDLPGTNGNKVGSLSTNQEVSVTGQCNETGWYRINLNGTTAYVSNNYLVDEKITVQAQANPAPAQTEAPAAQASTPQKSSLEQAYGVTLPATAIINVGETYMFNSPSNLKDYLWIDPSTCGAYTSGKYGTWGLEEKMVHRVFKGEIVTVHQFSEDSQRGWAYVTDEYGITGWVCCASGGSLNRIIFQ